MQVRKQTARLFTNNMLSRCVKQRKANAEIKLFLRVDVPLLVRNNPD